MAAKNLELAREGQITDRFTKAIEQLGAINQKGEHNREVRLGGIYALERIAKRSPEDHWPIMEVLTTYIRENAPWMPRETQLSKGDGSPEEKLPAPQKQPPPRLNADIQAILTVLGRRTRTTGEGKDQQLRNGEEYPLNLRKTDLRGANLVEAHLQGADLRDVQLEGAILSGAHLQKADLRDVQLEGAILSGAHLQGANLSGAQLQGADLRDVQLEGAILSGAQLQKADLRDVQLEGAILSGTQLQGANLSGAQLEGAILWGTQLQGTDLRDVQLEGAILGGTHLEKADLGGAQLQEADLTGAQLEGADLSGAHLEGAHGLTVEQLATAETLYNTHLDPPLLEQIRQQSPHLLEQSHK